MKFFCLLILQTFLVENKKRAVEDFLLNGVSMLKKINILLLSLVVFSGCAEALTPEQGEQLNRVRASFASAKSADALASVINGLRAPQSFWQSIKNTNHADQALDTGANNLSSVLTKFSTPVPRSNTFNITDSSLRTAVLGLVNDMQSSKLKAQFMLEVTASPAQNRSAAPVVNTRKR